MKHPNRPLIFNEIRPVLGEQGETVPCLVFTDKNEKDYGTQAEALSPRQVFEALGRVTTASPDTVVEIAIPVERNQKAQGSVRIRKSELERARNAWHMAPAPKGTKLN